MDTETQIWAVTTVSSNGHAHITGYLGGPLTAEHWRMVRDSGRYVSAEEVDAVPYEHVRKRDCLDLISRAANAGLVWHVSPRLGYSDHWTDLRVYAPDGSPLCQVAWQGERAAPGERGYTSRAEARRIIDRHAAEVMADA